MAHWAGLPSRMLESNVVMEMDVVRNPLKAVMLAALLGLLVAVAPAQRLEPNSFIRKHTKTIESFRQHVSQDPVVMDRYMRHFGMNREQVLAYFETLRPGTVAQTGPYLVYNVPAATGEIRHRVMTFKKGERVWVDQAGNYILKVSCGNPLVRGSDEPLALVTTTIEEPETELRALNIEDEGEPLVAYTPTPQEPLVPDRSPILIPPDIIPGASSAQFIPGGGFSPWPLLGLGLLGIRPGGGGDEPVPEPATMLALGAGAAYLVARRKKKTQ